MMHSFAKIVIQAIVMITIFLIGTVKPAAQSMMTVEDAIALALQYNYDIQMSMEDSSSAALDYEYRNAVFLPRINATAATVWNYNSQKQEFANADNNRKGNVQTNNVLAAVNLNWTLFDGFKMFTTRKKYEEYIALGSLEIKEQVVNTVADVVRTYYAVVRQKQLLRAIEEQMSINQTRVDLAQRKLEIGVGTKPDVLQSQVDLNAQKAAHLKEETAIEQLKETLNQLIRPATGDSPGGFLSSYEVSDSIPVQMDLAVEDIQAQLEQMNPSLQILRKQMEISALTLDEIRADRWPVIQFNSAYNFNRTNNNVALNQFLPIFNRNSGFNYGFSATIPILNYRNTQRLIRQEELSIGFQRLNLSNQQSILKLGVLNAYKDFEFQKQALALEEENIGLARENVNIILETYRLGNSTYLQLREAQQSLEEAYDRLIAARYNTKLAEIELLRLKGDLVR